MTIDEANVIWNTWFGLYQRAGEMPGADGAMDMHEWCTAMARRGFERLGYTREQLDEARAVLAQEESAP